MVKIYWIRHGFSCSNAEYYVEDRSIKRLIRNSNPRLADLGVQQCETAQLVLPRDFWDDIDYFCSSVLLRSIETAHRIFPSDKPFHILPYCHEISHKIKNHMDSYMYKIEDRRRGKEYKEVCNRVVDYSKHKVNKFDRTISWDYIDKNDNDFFIASTGKFNEFVLSEFPDDTKIAVVSHGNFMLRMLTKRYEKDPEYIFPNKEVRGHYKNSFINTEIMLYDSNASHEKNVELIYTPVYVYTIDNKKEPIGHLHKNLCRNHYNRCFDQEKI